MDDRIIFDHEPDRPSAGPRGVLIGLAVAAIALAFVALRSSGANPNSLGASPPTTLFVPPEARATTVPERSLQQQVPGLRGALHFEVSTGDGRQLWVWNAAEPELAAVDVPGPIDISANRRFGLATTVNQAHEGVVWLGPKLDMRPAAIVPGLTGAVWHRSESEWLVVGQREGTDTVLTWWHFSGAEHAVDRSLRIAGSWEPVYLTDHEIGLVSTAATRRFGDRSVVLDAATGDQLLEFGGRMRATTGPPVVYECHNIACTSATIGWIEAGTLQPSPRNASIFPSTNTEHLAAVTRAGTGGSTEIVLGDGTALLEIPSSGEVGAWSGDGRFFVYSKTEFGFGDNAGLVFVDTQEATYHEVAVPVDGSWFVTNIWYGP